MLPVQDVIPTRTIPWVMLAFLAVSLAAFAVQVSLAPGDLQALIHTWGLVPSAFAWYMPVSALLLHQGALHLGVDLLALWVFGASVEDRLGHGRMLVFMLVTGTAGNLAEVTVRTGSPLPVVGASGLVAGVMAAHLVLYPRSRTLVLVPGLGGVDLVDVPSPLLVACWFLLEVLGTSGALAGSLPTGGTAAVAMLVGVLSGLLVIWPLRRPERERVEWWGA